MLLEIRNTSVLLLVSAANGFLVLRTGAITKWRNTKDWKDTEQYSHHKTKPDYTQTGGGGGGGGGGELRADYLNRAGSFCRADFFCRS